MLCHQKQPRFHARATKMLHILCRSLVASQEVLN